MSIFKLAKAKGIEDLEIYTSVETEKTVKTFNGTVESYQISDQALQSVRGIYEGKMGYVYTEDLNEDQDTLLSNLIDNAKVVASPDVEEIFAGSEKYPEVDTTIKEENVTYDQIIETLAIVDRKAKEYSEFVTDTNCTFTQSNTKVTIENSKGLKLEKENRYYFVVGSVVGTKEDQRTNVWGYTIKKNFSDINPEELALEGATDAISQLGAEPCESGSYPVILKNTAVDSILSVLKGAFYAENVQKGLSPLKEKLNTQIFGENINLVDDPFFKDGLTISTFDDEGVATEITNLVENGMLNSYLYNLKSAKKDNVTSTGNGFKAGVSGKVGTSATNLYLKPGNYSFDGLLEGIEKGVYITEVAGTHSGINAINGDFSLQSQGFLIENGKLGRPVRLITIGGNFFTMFSNVEKIANDIKTDYSGVGSPSVLIKDLAVSGK